MRTAKTKTPPLALVVWANIQKWMLIRGVDDEEIGILIGCRQLYKRKQKLSLSIAELDMIAKYLAIEPEKLLER